MRAYRLHKAASLLLISIILLEIIMKNQIARLRAIADRSAVRGAVAVSMLTGAGMAHAEDIDVSAAVTTIGTGGAAIAAIGLAFLTLTILKKLWGKLGGR